MHWLNGLCLILLAISSIFCSFLWLELRAIKIDIAILQARIHTDIPEYADDNSHLRTRRSDGGRKKKGKKCKTAMMHYETFASKDYISSHFGSEYDDDGWHYSKDMQGWINDSQDFDTNSSDGILHVFKPEDWPKKRKPKDPFVLQDQGIFKATKPGKYLIYAQVMFHSSRPEQVIQLQKRSGSGGDWQVVQSCVQNWDRGKDQSMVTCGFNRILLMSRGDQLALVNPGDRVYLNLGKQATYLGAIFFC